MKGSLKIKSMNARMMVKSVRPNENNMNKLVESSASISPAVTAGGHTTAIKPLMSSGDGQQTGPQSLRQFMSQPFKYTCPICCFVAFYLNIYLLYFIFEKR